nr:26S proteasome regulatory subunit S10B homolog B [Tanacetum cinerariifolium]
MTSEGEEAVRRRGAVTEYRKKMLQHKELDSRVRTGDPTVIGDLIKSPSKFKFVNLASTNKPTCTFGTNGRVAMEAIGPSVTTVGPSPSTKPFSPSFFSMSSKNLQPLLDRTWVRLLKKYPDRLVQRTGMLMENLLRSKEWWHLIDPGYVEPEAGWMLTISKCIYAVRESLRTTKKDYAKTEDDLKSLQSVGQIIGEVLRPLDNERLIVKASSGPRYVVGCRSKVDKEKLTAGTRVVLDMTTLTIMRALPREVDPVVYNMLHEDPGNVSYSAVGGLGDQIRELRESIELPLMNPELFIRVGIKPPKGVLLYGPPGTGKTLLARAIASNIDANFLKVVSSAIIDKYIGESARLIREMFSYARDHQPCIIFMDEIDAIGGRRFSEGTSADREIQRTLMELLNQLDGFDQLGKVKMIMATNRPDGFNGADLRNVCTEAGMSAIRAERDYVIHEDFMKAVRKLNEAKKLESSAHYNADFGKD